MADLKVSQLPVLAGADLVATDRVLVLDKSATSGAGSGAGGTLKQMEASRLASFTTTKGVVRNLSLVGVDTSQQLFTWVAQAINLNGPYTGNAGEDLYFRTYQVSGPQNNYSVTIMYFKLLSGRLTAGGPSNTIAPSELVLAGGPWVINGETNSDLFLAIGDAGSGPVHSYFNLGEDHTPGGDPWTIAGQIFLTGTLDGQPTIWQFLAGDGDWGGDSGNFTTADDFINLSLQPAAAGFELTKIHQLSLGGIDLNQPELNYIAAAVLAKGPFTCLPGQQMVFRTQTTIGTQTNYSVVRRYYRLVKNYTSVGGAGALFPLPSWFMPDGDAYVQPVEGQGIIVELGDIGTANVWDVFNEGTDLGEAWDMSVYRFVRATQDAEIRFWAFEGLQRYYGGDDAGTDPDIYLATEDDFFLLTDEPTAPAPVNKLFYEDIAAMIANQAEQTTQTTLCVDDASDDSDITFASGETRLQAFYRWLGTTDEDIYDYELVSAPYGNHTDGGDATIEFQPEITDTATIFDGTQKGTGKIYPFNKSTAQTVTIEKDDYLENDTINIERRGLGTLEIVQGADVRFRGVRDEENRFFINDPNSMASLICRGSNEFSIIGNLKRGSLGAVTISSYLPALAPTETRNITVTGTGFSANMVITITGNATLNSWTFVSETEITLNVTSSGVDGDFITVTYDNGDIFEDTNAIELVDVEYVATNYPFDSGFGLFKMNASQVYAIRVRRSSDNAETDVGFNENYKVRMDSPVSAGGDLTSWIGSDDGFIVKMYDQGSVGDDMVQTTTSAQPKLITAGVMNIEDDYPFIVFDGVDDYMEQSTARQWGNGNDNTYALMCKTHSVTGDKVAFTDRPSSGFHTFFLYANNKANFNSGNITLNSGASLNTVYKQFAVRAIGGTSKLYVDGTLTDSDTGVTTNTNTNKLRLGISTATAQNVKLNHAIIWKSNKDANQSDISSIINGFI